MKKFVNVEDYRQAARRRLPRIAFDYLDPGAEDGITCQLNRQRLQDIYFEPRVLQGVATADVDLRVNTFGAVYRLPLAIAPTGFASLFWPQADVGLARCAAQAGIPYIMSTASTTSIEEVAHQTDSGATRWFQLYLLNDRDVTAAMVERARDAAYSALVLTVDTPCAGKREASIRHGARLPLRLDAEKLLDFAQHPGWAWQMLRHGQPRLANFSYSREEPFVMETHLKRRIDWEDVRWLRQAWSGPLILKGVQCVHDAQLALEHGLDAIVVSNHGGRQLDGAQSPMQVLGMITQTVGQKLTVMADSGFRRGSDVVKALACGAHSIWLGRATLYGMAARGPQGAAHVLSIIEDEMRRTMTLLGVGSLAELNASLIRPA
ncbi:MAG: alpha-hydroxy acid oxidase [Achromobacter sp.]|uniref:alpha-hydroxy acid oxidase n=1 Tax=Achromobacter sp. TaxID=134375 RepID=UPI0029B087AC|nr:alpha-hydroxy acid oxidase [Achromobacter sp.]MDX3985736.1 alpha-hydroxy acid oxidase [Achromobacter sp.]